MNGSQWDIEFDRTERWPLGGNTGGISETDARKLKIELQSSGSAGKQKIKKGNLASARI